MVPQKKLALMAVPSSCPMNSKIFFISGVLDIINPLQTTLSQMDKQKLGVKAAKRLIIDSTKSDSSLDNNKTAQGIMQYCNTPLPLINLSPAQILFHHQLHDHNPY